MGLNDEIVEEVLHILTMDWQCRDGRVVPDVENVALGNHAVTITGTVLYADLADSTGLVKTFGAPFAAKIYKSYLVSTCRVIRRRGGEITAFDGDRVMAVFLGDTPNSNAAIAALEINCVVTQIINVAIKQVFPRTQYQVKQAVGIDASKLFVARTGIRGSNDLERIS